MIQTVSPALAKASIIIRPEDLLLKENSWVKFTAKWPDTHDWVINKGPPRVGKCFRVTQSLCVRQPYSYILPGRDYKKLDLSNAANGLKLYPTDQGVLYEIALGLKPGAYIVHIYVSTNRYIFHLADPDMSPDVTDEARRYLGAIRPEDSPHNCPLVKLYAIANMAAFQLWDYVEGGVDFEKTTIVFYVNKCKLEEIALTPEQQERALTIRYYDELISF